MAAKEENLVLVDPCWGSKGYGAWLAPLNWFVSGYAVFMLFQLFLIPDKAQNFGSPLLFWIIYSPTFLLFSLALVVSVVFFKQAIKTTQRIKYCQGVFTAQFYYGRKMTFSVSQIKTIKNFNLRILNGLLTPLSRDKHNFNVLLDDGSHFYISGNMPGISDLIDVLE